MGHCSLKTTDLISFRFTTSFLSSDLWDILATSRHTKSSSSAVNLRRRAISTLHRSAHFISKEQKTRSVACRWLRGDWMSSPAGREGEWKHTSASSKVVGRETQRDKWRLSDSYPCLTKTSVCCFHRQSMCHLASAIFFWNSLLQQTTDLH